jgi:hypothetical protein
MCHVLATDSPPEGNIVLTDHQYTILSLLRPRVDNEDVRFAARERYPIELAHMREDITAEVFASDRVLAFHSSSSDCRASLPLLSRATRSASTSTLASVRFVFSIDPVPCTQLAVPL